MTSQEFCVVCGRLDRPLTDGICAECAVARTPLVTAPQRGEVVLCPQCGARRKGGRWDRSGRSTVLTAEDLAPFLSVHPEAGIRELRWEEVGASATVREMAGHARVVFRGVETWVEVPLSVRLVAQTCTDCGRKSGHYYTALVQLRGAEGARGKRPKELKDRLADRWEALLAESRADVREAISWTEERPEGWDVYFADTLAARAVGRLAKQRYGVKVSESASLYGRKNGQDVYRVTFLLRFLDLAMPRAAGARADAPVEP